MERSLDDGRCRDEIVREAVVKAALELEEVLDGLEEGDVALREGLERLLVVGAAHRAAG